MFKWLMVVFFSFVASNFLLAQQNKFEIKGSGSNVYIEHTVTPKENFYSVGRMYNVNPKELASFNHLHFASGLNIGQVLKIPLDKNNFTQVESAAVNETLIPLYHTVASGETLYRLGVNYNKVPLSSLKRWNRLSSDELSVGHPMIIGFLKVDKTQSSLAKKNSIANVQNTPEPKTEITTETQLQKPVSDISSAPEKTEVPATKPQVPAARTSSSISVTTNNNPDFSGGYFKNLYEQQTANKSTIDKSGSGSVFKSTSGWHDKKYYCFSNDAVAGTVLKITDNATGKSVYAKVLDAIPDISQNEGLITVISNAAADALGAGENKFDCVVSFAKQ
jgi:LysM repeat protein